MKLSLLFTLTWLFFKFSESQDCSSFSSKYTALGVCYSRLTVGGITDGRCFKNRDTLEVIMSSLQKRFVIHECQYSRTKPDKVALSCGTNLTNIDKLEFRRCDLTGFNMRKYSSGATVHKIVIIDNVFRDFKIYFDIGTEKNITFLYASSRDIFDVRFDRNMRNLEVFKMYKYNVKGFLQSPFVNLTNLKTLCLVYGTLNSLDSDFLKGMGTLQVLDLTENQIGAMAKHTFSHLRSLRKLNLEGNNIRQFPENLFKDVPTIQELNIKSNKRVDRIPNEYFRNARDLRILIASNCSLKFIENTTFARPGNASSNIKILDLSRNEVIAIQAGSFDPLRSLEKFDISYNPITVLHPTDPFGPSKSLREAIANNCNLTEMPTVNMQKHNLEKLDFSYNRITNIHLEGPSSKHTTVLLNDNNIAVISINNNLVGKGKPAYVLRNNRLRCTCHSKEFFRFLKNNSDTQRYFPDAASLICRGTEDVKLIDVNPDSLNCPSYCPLDCYCQGNVVQCKNLKLTEPPFPLPSTTKVLHLQNNRIESLSTINPNYWKTITHLYASNNSLKSLEDWRLSPGFVEVSLDGNLLKSIPPSLMEVVERSSLIKISLANNEWRCDCDFIDVKNWFTRNKGKIRDVDATTCLLPSSDRGVISDIAADCFCGSSAGINSLLITLISIITVAVLIEFSYTHRAKITHWIRKTGLLLPRLSNKNATTRIHPVENDKTTRK